MERFEEYLVDQAGSLGMAVDEPPQLLDDDVPEHEQAAGEPVSTDDPVRVYLREMGSVRLLKRQGEIDLAQRMERGTWRIRKALSRSALVRRRVLALFEKVRTGEVWLDEVS